MVSFILPVHNAARYIKETIDSVLNQTYTNFELIIINDASKDGSDSLIKKYDDPRINYFENKNNLGLIKTLNFGISKANGEYIARIDADDTCAPDRLAQQVELLQKRNEIDLVGTHFNLIDSEGKHIGISHFPTEAIDIHYLLNFYCPIAHPSVMFRKEVFIRNGQYDENDVHIEDFALWKRISTGENVYNLPVRLVNIRKHDSNITVSNRNSHVNRTIQFLEKGWSINFTSEEFSLLKQAWKGELLNSSDLSKTVHLVTRHSKKFEGLSRSSLNKVILMVLTRNLQVKATYYYTFQLFFRYSDIRNIVLDKFFPRLFVKQTN